MTLDQLKIHVAAVLPGAEVRPMLTRRGKPARRFGRLVLAEVIVKCGANSWWPLFVGFDGRPIFDAKKRPESLELSDNLLRMRTNLIATIEELRAVIGAT